MKIVEFLKNAKYYNLSTFIGNIDVHIDLLKMSDCANFLFRSLKCLCRKILTLYAFESDWPACLMTISHLKHSETKKFLNYSLFLRGCCNVKYQIC